jgi:hypothetical protein
VKATSQPHFRHRYFKISKTIHSYYYTITYRKRRIPRANGIPKFQPHEALGDHNHPP